MNLTPPKHLTPGPWRNPGTDGGEYVICAPDKRLKLRTLAHVYKPDDAQAIAALPQALKALELAHDYFINLPPSQHDAEAHLAVLTALLDSGYTRKDA